jgi:undecaprenyl diphosphate synthase
VTGSEGGAGGPWRRLRRRLKVRAARGIDVRPGGAEARYVAIIMDGNGRWAAARHLPVAAGHRAGARTLRRVLEHALDRRLEEVSIYSFSTENWTRPAEEVDALMDLFIEMIETQVPDLHERGARVRFLGRRDGVDERLLARIEQAETLTAGNTKMTLYIAFNYGARRELLDAAQGLIDDGLPEASDEAFRAHLYAPEMHDPELLIRTSGELRVSNFLLWQIAYAELYFTGKLWPDFDEDDLDEALAEYARRQRRFGSR